MPTYEELQAAAFHSYEKHQKAEMNRLNVLAKYYEESHEWNKKMKEKDLIIENLRRELASRDELYECLSLDLAIRYEALYNRYCNLSTNYLKRSSSTSNYLKESKTLPKLYN